MPTQPIPIHSSLSDVYTPSSLLKQGARWNGLLSAFQKSFGVKAETVCRAPGRVNIISDHVDYCGFSVLPAAIERDVLIAYSTSDLAQGSSLKQPSKAGKTVLHLQNLDPAYPPREYEVDLGTDGTDIEMPAKHDWSSYFLAGVKGILAHLAVTHSGASSITATPAHLQILITGSVPPGSGLSSSSAMVVASSLTILQATGRRAEVGRRDFTQVCIASERLVGVNSGGMDQAASVFSQPLNLLHIEFIPELKATPIPLPVTTPAISFVISNTLVTSDKRSTAKFCYNLRVVETRLAARLLARHLNVPLPPPSVDGSQSLTLGNLMTSYFDCPPPPHGPNPAPKPPTGLSMHLPTVPALPSSHLAPPEDRKAYELKLFMTLAAGALGGPGREEGETWGDIYKELNESEAVVQKEVVGKNEVEPIGGKLKIWKRTRHVLSEALRAYEFCALLKSASSVDSSEAEDSAVLLEQLGQLIRDSQTSARVDSQHSCAEIDEMVDLALSMGALGCRATGAGWGGATVSLVPEPKVAEFVKGMKEKFYGKHYPKMSEEELDDACFATKPEAGACVVVLED